MFYKKAILVVSIGVFFLSIVPFHSYLVALAEFSAQSYLKYLCVTVLCHCLPQLTLIDSQVICTASNVELEQEQHYRQLYLKNHFPAPHLYVIMFLVSLTEKRYIFDYENFQFAAS